MIKLLQILKETKNEGEDLNTIDFDYVIEHRIRDIVNPSILEEITIDSLDDDLI